MPTGNDASDMTVAASNCSFCTVAGMAGKTAREVMLIVYGKLGKPMPNGVNDDSSKGFAEYYAFFNKTKKLTNNNEQGFQVEGIRLFLSQRGIQTKKVGDVDDLMTIPNAEKYVNSCAEGTLFMIFAGDADAGTSITSLGHWTAGQVQNGKGVYYDYQTKVTNGTVRDAMHRRSGRRLAFDDTTVSEHMIGPLGQSYDEDDGRAMLIEVIR